MTPLSINTFLVSLSVWIVLFPLSACTKDRPSQETKVVQSEGTATGTTAPNAVTISTKEQKAGGITVTPLKTASHRREITAYGTVIDLQGLFSLRNRFAEAQAGVDQARAKLAASRKSYERLKSLYAEGQDISEKSLQASEASFRADEADSRAAQQALETVKATLLQQWGGTIAAWIRRASPDFDRLVHQDDVLVRLTIPTNQVPRTPPATAMIAGAGNQFEAARFVSPSPVIDPALQGASFFYVAPAKRAGLFPGMNVLAYLERGPEIQGVIIPASAVVWRRGKAWAFVRQGEDRFVRREVATDTPIPDGWFVSADFSPGESVVTNGAELVLSRELLPSAPAEEDED